jgi:hypothetical protein
MNTQLTALENELLNEIVGMYDENDNLCFTRELTNQEKGVMSSLVKKGLVYDSFESEKGEGYESHNYFPSDI